MTDEYGPLAVLFDPSAGEGRVAAEVDAVERALAERALDHRLTVVPDADALPAAAAAALDEGYRFLVAVGDDASVQGVLNGMFRDGEPIVEDPVLGVVAANSGCDLVRSFGLPGDVERATGHLAGHAVYPLDVMKVSATGLGGEPRTRYAHNVALVGLSAAAWTRRRTLPSRWSAERRRFLGFWLAYARSPRRRITIEHDRRTWEGRAFDVVVGNAQFTTGGVRLSPRSFPGDGVLDLLAFTGPRSDAYTLLPQILRHGDHVPNPHVAELRARIRFSVTSDRPMPVVADGEPLGSTPATFQIVPRRILLKV